MNVMPSLVLFLSLVAGLPGCARWENPYMDKQLAASIHETCLTEMNEPKYFKGKIDDLKPSDRYEYCMKSFGFEKKGANL